MVANNTIMEFKRQVKQGTMKDCLTKHNRVSLTEGAQRKVHDTRGKSSRVSWRVDIALLSRSIQEIPFAKQV